MFQKKLDKDQIEWEKFEKVRRGDFSCLKEERERFDKYHLEDEIQECLHHVNDLHKRNHQFGWSRMDKTINVDFSIESYSSSALPDTDRSTPSEAGPPYERLPQ